MSQHNPSRRRAGFTLIEIMAVVMIIGLPHHRGRHRGSPA